METCQQDGVREANQEGMGPPPFFIALFLPCSAGTAVLRSLSELLEQARTTRKRDA